MDEPIEFSDLSGPAKGVLGFLGVAFVTAVCILISWCFRRLSAAVQRATRTSKNYSKSRISQKSKSKPKADEDAEVSGRAAGDKEGYSIPVRATPGVSIKQLLKNSKAQSSKHGSEHKASQHPLYINTLKGHGDIVSAFAFSPDGKAVATVADDRILRVFRVTDIAGKGMTFIKLSMTKNLGGVAFGKSTADLAVLVRGAVDAAGLEGLSADNRLQSVWEQINVLGGRPALHLHSGCTAQGQAVLLVSEPKTHLVLYSGQGVHLGTVDHGGILTHDAAMSADGRFLAAATFTSDVKVYEACFDRSGAFVRLAKAMDLKGHKSQVLSVAFSVDGTRMVTSSKDGTLAVWNIAVRYKQQEDPKRLLSCMQEVTAPHLYSRLAFGPHGVIAGVSGRDVHLLDSRTGALLEVIEAPHDGSITHIDWAPVPYELGGKSVNVLGTSGTDSTVRLWRSPRL